MVMVRVRVGLGVGLELWLGLGLLVVQRTYENGRRGAITTHLSGNISIIYRLPLTAYHLAPIIYHVTLVTLTQILRNNSTFSSSSDDVVELTEKQAKRNSNSRYNVSLSVCLVLS
jgi:fluoride ion exporter CrcB/FEX